VATPNSDQLLLDAARDVREMKKALEALASRPAGTGAATALAGLNASYQKDGAAMGWGDSYGNHDWPTERLKSLQVYDRQAVEFQLAREKSYRRTPRLSGFGPYLAKVAGITAKSIGHTGTIQILRDQGLWDETYDRDGPNALEKEFDVHAASSPYIVKGFNGKEVRKTALAENSGQTGGYTIPPQFMNELLTIAAEDGFVEQRAKVIPMNTRTAQWPMLDVTTVQSTGTSPYFGGILAQWQPEAASINETEPAFKQSEWVAWDLVLYTVSSNQLLADNGIGLDALLTQLFGQAIVWYKEFAYLQGKGAGSSMPLGILNAPATLLQSRKQASHFVFQDAANMMSHLQIRSWDDACWIAHQSVLPDIIQMADYAASSVAYPGAQSAGMHLTWLPPFGQDGIGPAGIKMPKVFLNALPLFFTEKLPQLGTKGDVMLVDFSRYVIGMRLDMQIDVSPHYLFRNNQLAWRVIARCDGKPWLNSYITDAEGYQISPFVVLN